MLQTCTNCQYRQLAMPKCQSNYQCSFLHDLHDFLHDLQDLHDLHT
jgi:hypothetical protein